jgi:hypothetical protein
VCADETLDRAAVARRLGLGEDHRAWLAGLEELGPIPAGARLPSSDEAEETLRRLGFNDPDVEDVLPALATIGGEPEVWWLLERCVNRVVRAIGDPDADSGPWLDLPSDLGVSGRCFWVFVYLAALPDVRRWHRARGIPDDVSWATLADLGRHVARFRRRNGVSGLDSARWLSLHFSGAIYALGRLQFNPYRLRTGPEGPLFWYEEGEVPGPGLGTGDPALGMHIPEAGPLTPEACDASIAAARTFFADHFPEHGARVVTCTSWLLDDQLLEHLPPAANIVRFQRRFELVPGAYENDDDIFQFVFHRPPSTIDDLVPRTTLERAIVAHVRAGNRWRLRTGWFELGPPD